MKDTDLKVIGKAKELAKHTYTLTTNADRFPKKVRHSLVDKMQIKCLEIFEALFEANRINNKTHLNERCERITDAITYCDELQFFIELSMELGYVKKQPAADVVEVVRCKDCEHWIYSADQKRCYCELHHYRTKKEDFCSYGVRRDT